MLPLKGYIIQIWYTPSDTIREYMMPIGECYSAPGMGGTSPSKSVAEANAKRKMADEIGREYSPVTFQLLSCREWR